MLLLHSRPLVNSNLVSLKPGPIQVLNSFILASDLSWITKLIKQHLEERCLEQKR